MEPTSNTLLGSVPGHGDKTIMVSCSTSIWTIHTKPATLENNRLESLSLLVVVVSVPSTSGGCNIARILPSSSGVGDTVQTLTWGAVTHATGYVLQRSTSGGNLFTTSSNIYTGSALTFEDTGLTEHTTYYYRVYATASGYTTDGLLTGEKMRNVAMFVMLEFNPTTTFLELKFCIFGYIPSLGNTV